MYDLAANTVESKYKFPEDFTGILKTWLNSLLLDEKSMPFYLNNLRIYNEDILVFGICFWSIYFILY